MDTAPAAVLGALDDPVVAAHPSALVANVGNFHTLAFQFRDGAFVRLFEHHTGLLTPATLAGWLRALAAGEISHAAVFADHGHGALALDDAAVPLDFVAVVGPRQAMLRDAGLPAYFAVPHGDQMLTGCFGLLRACADLEPAWREPITEALAGVPIAVCGRSGRRKMENEALEADSRRFTYHSSRIIIHHTYEVLMADRDITKDVLRMFNYGLYVATVQNFDGPRAATISWVTQASFEPRLVAVGMRKGTAICEVARANKRFAIQVVAADQTDFAKAFFKVTSPGRIRSPATTSVDANGLPLFDVAAAWLECEVVEEANAIRRSCASSFAACWAAASEACPATALALRDTPWHYGG